MSKEQTKVKARDVMPEILELLKRERPADTASINSHIQVIADTKGLAFRPQAVSFSLRVLKHNGWADNPARGRWCITEAGSVTTLQKGEVDALGKDLWGS